MKFELLPLNEISVYISIPSCSYSLGYSNRIIEELLAKLASEVHYYLSKLGFPSVRTLYIGSGTPSILNETSLAMLLNSFKEHIDFGSLDEFTFEANPESITVDKMRILSDFNLARLSLGIQSFNERLLKILGRRVSLSQIYASLEMATRFNFKLNLDLITGIPFQSKKDLQNDLHEIISFAPSHISLYDLVIEENTPLCEFFKNRTYKKDEEIAEEFWLYSKEFLENKGYINYEISNFSLKGQQSIHNSKYWELCPYLGIGPGSVSLLFVNEDNKIKALVKNDNDFLNYKYTPSNFKVMNDFEFFIDHFIMGLGTLRGASLSTLKRRFSYNEMDFSKFRDELLKFDGAFVIDTEFIYLKGDERFKLDFYLRKILDYFDANLFNPELKLL